MSSIDDIIQALTDYKNGLRTKADALAKALADAGAGAVRVTYADAASRYVGPVSANVRVDELGDGQYAIVADGQTVLFLEFGAGVYLGGGHPNPMGYGPGTYPGHGHWDDPRGWWLPKSAGAQFAGMHSYGNAPSAAMYHTGKSLHAMVEQAAKGVFGS